MWPTAGTFIKEGLETYEGLQGWQVPQSAGMLGTAPEKGGKHQVFAICFSQAHSG